MVFINSVYDILYFIISITPFLLRGLVNTLRIGIMSFIFGFLLGMVVGVCRVSGGRAISTIATSYVEVIRGTPLLVQILFAYFGLPFIGIKLSPSIVGVVVIGINSGAYQAEIIRSGILSIPQEQLDVAKALGMTNLQVMRYVILPQALRNIIPALVNEFVTLIKDSSLVSVIGEVELTRCGEYIISRTFRPFEVFFVVALLYLVVCFTFSKIASLLERRVRVPGYFKVYRW